MAAERFPSVGIGPFTGEKEHQLFVSQQLRALAEQRISDRFDGAIPDPRIDISTAGPTRKLLRGMWYKSPQLQQLHAWASAHVESGDVDREGFSKLEKLIRGASLEWLAFYYATMRFSDEHTVVLSPNDAKKFNAALFRGDNILNEGTVTETYEGRTTFDFYITRKSPEGQWAITAVAECTTNGNASSYVKRRYLSTKPTTLLIRKNDFPCIFDEECAYMLFTREGSELPLALPNGKSVTIATETVPFNMDQINDVGRYVTDFLPVGQERLTIRRLFERRNANGIVRRVAGKETA